MENYTIATIMNQAFALSTDEDGIELNIRMAAFNALYQAFLREFDLTFDHIRLKRVTAVSVSSGTSMSALGMHDGKPFNDFFKPFDIRHIKSDGSRGDALIESADMYQDHPETGNTVESYYQEGANLFFLGFAEGESFQVRYRPNYPLLGLSQVDSLEVFLPAAIFPDFSQGLVALYNAVEEEPQTAAERAPLIFTQYLKDFEKKLSFSAPITGIL